MLKKKNKRKLWGLISYRPRWGLTNKGWSMIFSAIALLLWLFIYRLEPFLAHSAPVTADILIVEGWIGDEGIIGAIDEFERKPYKLIITAGNRFGRAEYLSEYKDFAHLSEATMIELGFDPQKIQPIPTPAVIRDRTLSSAIEVKKWLARNQVNPQGINVYTVDAHSRRTWLLYKRVFQPEVPVGIIAHPPQDYDSQAWWNSSEGFRKVFSEGIAYVYAKFM